MKRILVTSLGLMLAIATMTNVAFAQNVDNVRAQSARATQAVTDAEAAVTTAKAELATAQKAVSDADAAVRVKQQTQTAAQAAADEAARTLTNSVASQTTARQEKEAADTAARTAKTTADTALAQWKLDVIAEAAAIAANATPTPATQQVVNDATAKAAASQVTYDAAKAEAKRLADVYEAKLKASQDADDLVASATIDDRNARAELETARQAVETAQGNLTTATAEAEAKAAEVRRLEGVVETAKRLAASLGLLLQNTDEITTTQSDVSNMKTEVRGKAQADSVTALARQLNELAETVAANARQTNERLKAKADKSDLQATNNEVAELRGTVGRQGTLLEAHEAELQRHGRRLNTIEEEMKSFLRIPLTHQDAEYLAEKLGILDLKKEVATHSVNAAKRFSDIETNLSNLKTEVASMPVPKRDAYVTKLVKTTKPNCYGQPVECWVYETVPLASLFQAKN